MAKRLTDTFKWDKVWFRKLSPDHKCLWIYICDKCDHSGIWEVDFETASYYIGSNFDVGLIKTAFSKQFIELSGGTRWFIKDFVSFQYGSLDETNRMYGPVIKNLNKYGVSMGDGWGMDGGKDKVKVKRKVIRRVINQDQQQKTPEEIWNE